MRNIYRFSILLGCFFIAGLAAKAQTFGNEWIDYSKTYYKFRVGKEGIYRIPKSVLDAAGIPGTTTGNQFFMYRDGQQIPLYVTTPGAMGSGDYIEFYGRPNNGQLDKKLYNNQNWHVNDSLSLFSDTASYFLSYGLQNYLRYTPVSTPIPGTPPPAELYTWYTAGKYFHAAHTPGTSYSSTDQLFSAQFDCAEAMVDAAVPINNPASYTLETPNVHPLGPNATIRINLVAQDPYATQVPIRVFLNAQQIKVDTLQLNPQPSTAKKFNISIPPAAFQANNTFSYTTIFNINGFHLIGTAQAEVVYARDCDLAGLNHYNFSLKANANPQYLEFTNFAHGGVSPLLYDLTNNKVYTGDITTTAGVTRFYIDASLSDRNLLLAAQNTNFTSTIAPTKNIQFTNYTSVANQGDFVIISHKRLRLAADGQDYVNKYREYRASAAGGGYTAIVADVEELYDQFAYGTDIHPLSIKNFLYYAHTNWTKKPEYTLLLGRGLLYDKYRTYLANQNNYPFPIVPTFGNPGSDVDFTNFGSDFKSKVKIGRISAWNGMEIGNFLAKIKAYEAAQIPAAMPTFETELWKKKFIHIAGGSDIALQTTLLNTLNKGANIIKNPLLGALVTTIAKNTITPIDQAGSELVDAMIDSGVNWITFHGHASAGSFDFNLNDPEKYTNSPRQPHLMALGCDVSQIFELNILRTISERYINAPGGSISVTAQDNLGYTSFHEPYLQRWYRGMTLGTLNYQNTLGTHYTHAYDTTLIAYNLVNNANNFNFTEVESMILLGDPATPVYSIAKPDYHISDASMSSIPSAVTTALDSFQLKITSFNLGKAISDTVHVKVEHINPQGVTSLVGTYPIVNLYNKEDYIVNVPIDKGFDVGLNKYRATIDYDGKFDENSEMNNGGTFSVFIYSDRLVPVWPHEFAIVGKQDITLKASTLNPFKPSANYKMEIDTTELFNSPMRQQFATTSIGGVVQWKPAMSYQDSVVYYWRAAVDSGNGSQPVWTTSSFIYLNQQNGWNQSHYFQYLKDGFQTLAVDNSRQFNFTQVNNNLSISNVVLTTANSTFTTNDVKVMFNDVDIQRAGCSPFNGTVQVFVFDTLTGQRWINPVGGTGGSYPRCFNTRNSECFEFDVSNPQSRQWATDFINAIPNGHYVLIRNFVYDPFYIPAFANDWEQDNGGNNTLYDAFKNLGFNKIDSFNKKRVFIMMCKKGDANWPITQEFSDSTNDKIIVDLTIPSRRNKGLMVSKVIGPAKAWETLKWKTSAYDNNGTNDSVYVKVSGLDNNYNEVELFSTLNTDTSIAGISTSAYPRLKMEWFSKDTINNTSAQLNYWRVHYQPVPEAALNPAAHLSFNDSLSVGQNGELEVAIEELSGLPMDSMLVKYRIIDGNGIAHTLSSQRYKKLNGNDTLHARISFDPTSYPGANFLFIEANPDNDQAEQYHPNNLGYIPFRVFVDKLNPLIDVTFDGIHILDRDIVSAKPFIKILLKDENKFLMMDDSSDIRVHIRYIKDNSIDEDLVFDGVTAKFIPAASTEKNEAIVEYRPTFLKDGFYELSVNGKDKAGNQSGSTDYKVTFEVINKSTITNVLNYPNPFSTSTAFLFTLTGSQIPNQFKIQILTVSGKVVREITKAELGPLHVGRNITEYKWDGKDQYGQLLGNGVYLYRVVTTINGEDIERRESAADKFNQKGYSKMYIMR
ncbi:MAG: hypothetical protein JNL72_00770 [Flavipsychrobacter sp.]|nr:hypothetical protein [Flavipsychrobacter sp.]